MNDDIVIMDTKDMDIPINMLDIMTKDVEPVDQEVLEDLREDIKRHLLLHRITVIGPSPDYKYYIKAGRKRFYACRELGYKTVPCMVLPFSTADEKIVEITISENLRRYNLPWWESAEKRAQLHELRQTQHGVGKQGVKVGWSLRDTAEELQMGFGTLSEDLRLAEAVRANPNLRKIKDKKTAKRLIFNQARRIEAETEAGLEVKVDFDCVLCGDASEVLKFYPDNTFDVVFTDPPWLDYKDPALIKDDKTLAVFKEVYRVMKADAFLYAIVSTPDFIIYLTEFEKIGFKVQQTPLIWHKLNTISHGTRSWEYGRDFEPILLAVKGSPVLSHAGQISSIYTSAAVHPTKLIHPNEKPVDVPLHFLNHCSYEGSLVLDPFGGSGVTGEACIELGRKYVIIERDKKFANGIEARLDNKRLAMAPSVLGIEGDSPEQGSLPAVP